jgi:hypothetical protein
MADQDSPRSAYKVSSPKGSLVHEAVESKAPRRSAVFVAHGMGQQIPFQTLDQVALGLRREDKRWKEKEPDRVPGVARTVENEPGKPFQRLELQLQNPLGVAHEVHVYESYWAPLTEGNVTLRDTMRFLLGGGFNGLANLGTFKRWLFGKFQLFSIPVRTVFYLLVAVAVVAALIVLNTTIGLVVAARSVLASHPAWLTDSLFADLTTTFNFVIVWMVLFVACLLIAKVLRRLKIPVALLHLWGLVTALFFVGALFVTIGAGGALPILLYGHIKSQGSAVEIWESLLGASRVMAFNQSFDKMAFRLLAALVLGALLWSVLRLLISVVREVLEKRRGRLWTLCVTFAFASIVAGLVVEGRAFWFYFQGDQSASPLDIALRGLSWPILVVASALVRTFMVQFIGDVAVYVTSNKLDRFYKVRQEIKDTARNALQAVYQRREVDGGQYDQVVVVGHSLGSVIVYDALNRLINEDMLNDGTLGVVGRTPLLVTFGSPLDKFAFLFALQKNKTDEAREALAASVQPLLEKHDFRPDRWVNIYSPWDIIGGKLAFFDVPGQEYPNNSQGVENRLDPRATTLLAAHTEYWENPLLFKTIFQQVTS